MDKKIVLRQNEEIRVNNGHLWVFSNEIKEITGNPIAGDVVEAYTSAGRMIGVGFYNPKSLIAFRLLSHERAEIDVSFWRNKISQAYSYRRKIYPNLSSFRALFGESDGLPGLIVDKYGEYLAIQMLSAGLETHRADIIEALKLVFSPKGIIARNDSGLRSLEGLEEKIETVFGTIPEQVEIVENDIKFTINLMAGQKTGFFFDQRDNRAAVAPYCTGKTVLDCFAHTGAFSMYALKAGATAVTAVDSSKLALDTAAQNAALNGLEKNFSIEQSDAEKFMEEQSNSNTKYDVVIIDPPALIKSKKNSQPGYRLYKKLNAMALRLVKPGGIFITSSCSHHLSPPDFRKMLEESAAKTGRPCILVENRTQSKDHPILLAMPETEYLKLAIIRMM